MNSIEWTTERRLFRSVTETTKLIAWATDASGHCFYLSPQWYAFTGVTKEEGMGFNWLTSVHPDDVVRVRRSFFSANDTRTAFGESFRLIHADGRYIPVWDVGLPKFGDDGTFQGFFGTTCVIQGDYAVRTVTSSPTISVLTLREREVLRLIAEGKSSSSISAFLGISERTVNAHVASAGLKLNASNRVHTVATALRLAEI